MEFNLSASLPILKQTPSTLTSLLKDLPQEWLQCREGVKAWSPHEVVGHLVHGEKTDWIPRVQRLLEFGEARPFEPFNRTGFIGICRQHSTLELLQLFGEFRNSSLDRLRQLRIDSKSLAQAGQHPDFGRVELSQLLAAWVVHDLGHIRQIVRTMARQYGDAVGPWKAYLTIVQ